MMYIPGFLSLNIFITPDIKRHMLIRISDIARVDMDIADVPGKGCVSCCIHLENGETYNADIHSETLISDIIETAKIS